MDRRYYLDNIPLETALVKFFDGLNRHDALPPIKGEFVPIIDSVGRILTNPVFANLSAPFVTTSAMDGIALKASLTFGINETNPKILNDDEFEWIDTGEPLPSKYDAVVMIENVERNKSGAVLLRSPVAPYQHVRKIAEDIAAPELLLGGGAKIRSLDLASLGAAGVAEVEVAVKPRVALIPTGSELVRLGDVLEPGNVIEFNSIFLSAMIESWGGTAHVQNSVPDEAGKIRAVLEETTAMYDAVLIIAGSSAGSEDFTFRVIEESGEVFVHGVAIRPGHPVVLGVTNSVPVVGLPGYPASASITSELFVKSLIREFTGEIFDEGDFVLAKLARKIHSPMGDEEFLRVTVGRIDDTYVATPTARGAAMTLAMSRSDGIVRISADSEGVDEGEEIKVALVRPRHLIDKTVIVSGSHDIALDVLGSKFSELPGSAKMVSTNVGSVGGLLALSKGYAHIAASHLLDEDTGQYNVGSIKRHLDGIEVSVFNFVGRTQGLIVKKGNPLNLESLRDIAEKECNFINRQRGSGTRLLLDFLLKGIRIDSKKFNGYESEEYTHWNVAAAVSSGIADVGVGIMAAARGHNLDFIPLGEEKFQLVVPTDILDTNQHVNKLIGMLKKTDLRLEIEAIGGYDVEAMGDLEFTI